MRTQNNIKSNNTNSKPEIKQKIVTIRGVNKANGSYIMAKRF